MAFAPRGVGCVPHCLVWFGGDPVVKIGCAHCSHVSQHLDLTATYTDQQISAAIDSSRTGHRRLCGRSGPNSSRPRPQPGRRSRAQ